ncbi:MAG: zinc-dependent metalloprotease [Bacteroidota bacterium]
MITRTIFLSYCLSIFSLLSAQETDSFCGWTVEGGQRWQINGTTWDCRIITYGVDLYCLPDNFVDNSGDFPGKIDAAVSGAVNAWNAVQAGVRLVPTSCDPDILITCKDLTPGEAGEWNYPKVSINDDINEWGYSTRLPCVDLPPTENDRTIDLQFLLTHELGHALGFAHDDCCGNIMQSGGAVLGPLAGIPACPDQRELAQDDIEGLLEFYPPFTIEREAPIDCGDVERFSFPIESLGTACTINSMAWGVNPPYQILSGQGTSEIEVGIIECSNEPINVRFMINSDCYNVSFRETFERDTDYCCDDIYVFGGALSSCCFGDITNLAVSTADIVAMGCDPTEIDFEWNLPQGFIIHPNYDPNSPYIGVYMVFNCGVCNPSAAISVTMTAPCLEKPVTYTKSVVSCCEAPDPGAITITPVLNRVSGCLSLELETENRICDHVLWTVSSADNVLNQPDRPVDGDRWDLECLPCDEVGKVYHITLEFVSDCGNTTRNFSIEIDDDDCVGRKFVVGADLDGSTPGGRQPGVPTETVLYPNPAHDYVIVGDPFMDGTTFTFEIYDLSGQLISDQITYPYETIDIAGLVPGMYLVRMTSFEDNSVIFEKLIVD